MFKIKALSVRREHWKNGKISSKILEPFKARNTKEFKIADEALNLFMSCLMRELATSSSIGLSKLSFQNEYNDFYDSKVAFRVIMFINKPWIIMPYVLCKKINHLDFRRMIMLVAFAQQNI